MPSDIVIGTSFSVVMPLVEGRQAGGAAVELEARGVERVAVEAGGDAALAGLLVAGAAHADLQRAVEPAEDHAHPRPDLVGRVVGRGRVVAALTAAARRGR